MKLCKEQLAESIRVIARLDAERGACINDEESNALRVALSDNIAIILRSQEHWKHLQDGLQAAQASLNPRIFQSTNAVRVSNIKLARIASDLCAAVSYYLMDRKRLHLSTQYPLGTVVHQTVMAGMKARDKTARNLLKAYNAHVRLQHNQGHMDPILCFEELADADLYKESTLDRLKRLGEPYGESDAPWQYNHDLQELLNAAADLARCDEEDALLRRKARSLNEWYLIEASRLEALEAVSMTKDWVSLLMQERHQLQALCSHWKQSWHTLFDEWRDSPCLSMQETLQDSSLGHDTDSSHSIDSDYGLEEWNEHFVTLLDVELERLELP